MRGYVGVKFHDKGSTYTYKIPDNINPRDIGEYVIVENAYRGPASPERYKIVEVVWVDFKNQSLARIEPTKYIVDYINDKPKRSLVDVFWNMLTIDERTEIIKTYLDEECID